MPVSLRGKSQPASGLPGHPVEGRFPMTVHFAASRSAAHSALASILQRRKPASAANDNCAAHADQMLHAALRHFARHGLGAAREARAQAERAFFAGDRESYRWWLDICRTLDARIARSLEETAVGGPAAALPLGRENRRAGAPNRGDEPLTM